MYDVGLMADIAAQAFLFIALLLLVAIGLVRIVRQMYFLFRINPIAEAWAPYGRRWMSWKDIKQVSRGKTFDVLVLISLSHAYGLIEYQMRKDKDAETLIRHYGDIEAMGKDLTSSVYYEFRIIRPRMRRKKKKEKDRVWNWRVLPKPVLQPV